MAYPKLDKLALNLLARRPSRNRSLHTEVSYAPYDGGLIWLTYYGTPLVRINADNHLHIYIPFDYVTRSTLSRINAVLRAAQLSIQVRMRHGRPHLYRTYNDGGQHRLRQVPTNTWYLVGAYQPNYTCRHCQHSWPRHSTTATT